LPGRVLSAKGGTIPARFQLATADAVAWLRSLPAASADLLITDPPYESLEKHRAVGTTTRLKHSKASSNDWFTIFPNARFPELFEAAHRVLKKNAHLYLFCDPETMFVAKPIGEAAGFKFWKPLIWDKRSIGMGYHYRARYETILFFEKGKRRLNDLGAPDIIEVPRLRGGYPSEKPVAVGEVLVRQSSAPGDLVVDPFAGSGTFGVAAVHAGRDFRGCDIGKEAVRLARGPASARAGGEVPGGPGHDRREDPLRAARPGSAVDSGLPRLRGTWMVEGRLEGSRRAGPASEEIVGLGARGVRMKVPNDERSSHPHRPRVMRRYPQGCWRSVDSGAYRPAIEPRNTETSERRRCGSKRKATRAASPRRDAVRLCAV
jgi:site-specific DNA-methyltransferase (adenine-specific)